MFGHEIEYYEFHGFNNISHRIKASESYTDNSGNLHNEEGPAYCSWYPDGTPKTEEYYYRGNRHSYDDEPSYKRWCSNGILRDEVWHYHGLVSRLEDPAYIRSDDRGICEIRWYVLGYIFPSKDDIERILSNINRYMDFSVSIDEWSRKMVKAFFNYMDKSGFVGGRKMPNGF